MELPYRTLQPGSWTPAPDPAVIVHSDCVEIRRIHLFFDLDFGLDTEYNRLDLDTLHRLLSARLRFA
jgi:hypothetical protein